MRRAAENALGLCLALQLGLYSGVFETIQVLRDHDDDALEAGVRTTASCSARSARSALARVLMVLCSAYALLVMHPIARGDQRGRTALPFEADRVERYWTRVKLVYGVAWLGDLRVGALAPRPAEGVDMTIEPVRQPVEVPSDSGLRLRILELRQQARRGEQAFDAAFGPAQAAVRAAGRRGSDSWVEAQQAISRLEAARSETMRALVQLDQLASGRSAVPTNADDFAAINGTLAVVETLAADQQARIDRLRRD